MGRKRKNSPRIEWAVSERAKQEAGVNAWDLRGAGQWFVKHVLSGMGRRPYPPADGPVFLPNSEFAIKPTRSNSGTLLLHLLHRDEATRGGKVYRAYLSPQMEARGIGVGEVREVVESCLRGNYPNPETVPESPDGTVCRHPDLPWRIYLYQSGGRLHLHCYFPGELDYDVTMNGFLGINLLGRVIEGVFKPVAPINPARDGQNRVRPLVNRDLPGRFWPHPSDN